MQVVFKTRIYHCNVDSAGNLSVDILKDGWSPALTISKVLLAIRSIFTNPDPCKSFHLLGFFPLLWWDRMGKGIEDSCTGVDHYVIQGCAFCWSVPHSNCVPCSWLKKNGQSMFG